MSVRLSVRPSARNNPPFALDRFSWKFIFEFFLKSVEKIQFSLKWVLYTKTNIRSGSQLAQFFLERDMFEIKFVEKIKTHILCAITFFRKPCRLWDNVEKYCRTGPVTDDNVALAHCMLYTVGYRHKLTIHNTYSFATATMVARLHLNVTFICTFPVLLTTV
jgi:hypothetical protein